MGETQWPSRPAAYLNLLMTVFGIAHGSWILAWIQQNGVVIEWPWFEAAG